MIPSEGQPDHPPPGLPAQPARPPTSEPASSNPVIPDWVQALDVVTQDDKGLLGEREGKQQLP